ncbi:NUDIX domain-containing protein [Streptomyces sp. NPDC056549]|uniref:NUDIX domain-containing protein n=1 Tax=Streptomyces sp. NPDC056549 TaxID=3345864 RepID=UPI0036A4D3F4
MLPSPTTADGRVPTTRATTTSFVTTPGPGTGTRPSHEHLRSTVAEYLARHPGERDALSGLLAALDGEEHPTHRASLPGHITCSGVVIDADGQVLHIEHKASGLLLTPGGHVEAGDATLLAAALREIAEETGIPPAGLVLTPEFGHTPIDVDVHRIEAAEAKGEGPHEHYDFRFVFRLAAAGSPDLVLQEEEVSGAVWLPQHEVRSPTLRAKLHDAALEGTVTPVNASAVIHDGQGRYLLHLRDVKPGIWAPGCWDLLGGGREPEDATPLDTVVRELREEAGLEIPGLRPYAVDHVPGTDGTLVPVQLFTGEWHGDPGTLTLTEGQLLAWRSLEHLPYLTMLPSTRQLLERHAAERPACHADDTGGAAGARWARAVVASAPPGTEPHIVGVHLVLEQDGKVLLGLRHPDSAYAGGMWHVLAGHCEYESATACLVREALEEAGLVIRPDDLTLVHTVHAVDRPGGRPRIQLFFRAGAWEGTPELREPDKTVAWRYEDVDGLPDTTVPYTRAALEGIRAGRPYTEMGWSR